MFDQDPQRVCILQGPVAVKHAKVKDEPIAELLGGIVSQLADRLLARTYNGDVSKVPTVDYLGEHSVPAPSIAGVQVESKVDSAVYTVGSDIPDTNAWLETLAGEKQSWLRALLVSPFIVQGNAYTDSPIRRLFNPRVGQKVVVKSKDGVPSTVEVYGSARSFGKHKDNFKAVEISYEPTTKRINVTMFEDRRDVSVPLSLIFDYRPDMGYAPIHEVVEGRNKRIKAFYWKLWFGDDSELPDIDVRGLFEGPEVRIEEGHVESFCSVVGNDGEVFKSVRSTETQAPMDFAIVTGWQVRMVDCDFTCFFVLM